MLRKLTDWLVEVKSVWVLVCQRTNRHQTPQKGQKNFSFILTERNKRRFTWLLSKKKYLVIFVNSRTVFSHVWLAVRNRPVLGFLIIHFCKWRYSHLHSSQRLLPQDYATDTFFSIFLYGKIKEVTKGKSVRERSLKEQRGGWESLQGAVESYEESWWGVVLCQQAKSLSKGEGWGKTRNGKLIFFNNSYLEFSIMLL